MPHRHRPLVFALLAACVLVFSVPVAAQQGAPDGEWPTYGGDLGHTRYSALDQIDADNFSDLEVAWRFGTENLGPRPEFIFQATPLMVNGMLYTTAGTRRAAVAIDAATGEMLWMHRLNEGERGAGAPRRLSGRGLTYWDDSADGVIFYVTPGYRLIALNALTGRRMTNFGDDGLIDLKQGLDQDIDPVTGEIGLHAAPIISNGVIIIGAAHLAGVAPPTKEKPKGHIRGFDARTGERKWIFHTIPGADEFGNDSWQNDSWRYTGNTGVWGQMTIDEDLGYVYLPVEMPTGDLYGGHRLGDNLFADSVVAVEIATGNRVWHYQTIHHDVLGLRPAQRADPGRHHGGRTTDQGARPAEQAGVSLRARSRDRRAGLADRGTAGAAVRRTWRGDVGDPAVPDETTAVRSAGVHRRRPDRLYPCTPCPRRGSDRTVPDRPALHAAIGRFVRGHARHVAYPGLDRWLELAGRVVRPGDRHLLHLLEDTGQRPGAGEQPATVEHGLHHGPAKTTGRCPRGAGVEALAG